MQLRLLLFSLFLWISYCHLHAGKCPYCEKDALFCNTPKPMVKNLTGKWQNEMAPKRGYTCKGIEDLGPENPQLCEMCLETPLRYAHHMLHGQFQLKVEGTCATYMEGFAEDENAFKTSKYRVQNLEKLAKERWEKREAFLTSKAWKMSAQKNPYIMENNNRVLIFLALNKLYIPVINSKRLLEKQTPNLDDAKRAAFDYLYPSFQANPFHDKD